MRIQKAFSTTGALWLLTVVIPAVTLAADTGTSQGVAGAGSATGAEKRDPPGDRQPQQQPRPRAKKPPAVGDDDASYRCRPDEDIACTVIRETAQGILIVTFRPAGNAQERKTWAVVSGTPAGAAPNGGTVYVVPNLAQNLPAATAMSTPMSTASYASSAASLPNGAPILE